MLPPSRWAQRFLRSFALTRVMGRVTNPNVQSSRTRHSRNGRATEACQFHGIPVGHPSPHRSCNNAGVPLQLISALKGSDNVERGALTDWNSRGPPGASQGLVGPRCLMSLVVYPLNRVDGWEFSSVSYYQPLGSGGIG
ncbi:hypothetical protein DPEC_G00359080 [Dallia pectoralis]|uniref:Uncharacterized protein n=1 Tax=Dallia pectoralis TaxID=75939 RepID=A0ACC2F0I5_DALPE|nr:hypothetical protein DPEC_G00359080 [Dallia pectoralis]